MELETQLMPQVVLAVAVPDAAAAQVLARASMDQPRPLGLLNDASAEGAQH
jgi:hypothetical protein